MSKTGISSVRTYPSKMFFDSGKYGHTFNIIFRPLLPHFIHNFLFFVFYFAIVLDHSRLCTLARDIIPLWLTSLTMPRFPGFSVGARCYSPRRAILFPEPRDMIIHTAAHETLKIRREI